MKTKKLIILVVIIAIAALLWIGRYHFLRAAGNFLIVADKLQPCVYAFVLSGGPWDRGNEATRLFNNNMADTVVCTGENIPHDFKALGLHMTECEITRANLLQQGIPPGNIVLIKKGTSTKEESDAILDFCKKRAARQIIVISTDFHTRRVSQVFRKKFRQEGITVIVHAAPSTSYDAKQWWASENGLIALNNEYLKQIYYLLKH